MTQRSPSSVTQEQSEIKTLRQALQIRDQLVQQLSAELARLLFKPGPSMLPPATSAEYIHAQPGLNPVPATVHEQAQETETQLRDYQKQVMEREAEIADLRQQVDESRDRNHRLEQTVQELPEVYRQKFAARLESVLQKVDQLRQEKYQLQRELQTVSYQLACLTRESAIAHPQRSERLKALQAADSDSKGMGNSTVGEPG